MQSAVRVWCEPVTIPTFEPLPPDRNPMFLEKRVYQGSSGAVYPLPFCDRIAEQKSSRVWNSVQIENEFLRVMILPEIGGRIHAAQDKTNGYDFFYQQPVIKPALVGLAGSWISGGVEFNWPQHHRPATFMPVDTEIEHHEDGSVTIWCSDHDPMARMKGMHGICLHPGKAFIELKVRAYNRTPFVQTFLWWANVATRVHEAYQSFFPPDVHYVADHARRSMSEYPLCERHYYGVDYQKRGMDGVTANEAPSQFRPPHCGGEAPVEYVANDLSFYANIPVPTSYMCMGSKEDFFGGYDHRARAGVVHIANHHISPGKKQWTWGNHDFGYAWDRNLTESDEKGEFAPYIELMAGVYTDNQPDFSFLMPGETKSWSQYWYPIQEIGPANHANLDAAVSLRVVDGKVGVGVSVSSVLKRATITLSAGGKQVAAFEADLGPGAPLLKKVAVRGGGKLDKLSLRVIDAKGGEIISYTPGSSTSAGDVPPPAKEPLPPSEIASVDELFTTGLHLEQYRHATRSPEIYWEEAIRRDPGDSRCNNALGLRRLRRGEFVQAEAHFRKAIERLTLCNANPRDGEPYYNLGLTLRHLGREQEAYAAFYKAAWNQAWQSAAYHELAELDCRRKDWRAALDHIDRSLRLNTDNLRARNLQALVLRRLGLEEQASATIAATLTLDPLDWWARFLAGHPLTCDAQTRIDVALDLSRAGFDDEALLVLAAGQADPGTAPLLAYYTAWIHTRRGDARKARTAFQAAAKASPDYCFPARLEEIAVLEAAMQANPTDARAPYYLGNLFYDRRRHRDAMRLWEKSAKLDPNYSVVWRNLGIAYFNIARQPAKARAAYEKAFRAAPNDARLLYERDQLWKRLGEKPEKRLRELEKYLALVEKRDDLSVELCALYNQTGRHALALEIVGSRKFQPWEGGEGMALGQHVRTHIALGREALGRGDAVKARAHFSQALSCPEHLGEARHPLANQSDIHFWLGVALERLGERSAAKAHWKHAAEFKGDFQEMNVRAYTEMTYYSALSMAKLGKKSAAERLLNELQAYAQHLAYDEAKIDYFATSLPAMLLFEDDIQERQRTAALFLEAQALAGLEQETLAASFLQRVLERDPNHPLAPELTAALALAT